MASGRFRESLKSIPEEYANLDFPTDLSDYPVVVHVLSRIDFRSGKVRLRHPHTCVRGQLDIGVWIAVFVGDSRRAKRPGVERAIRAERIAIVRRKPGRNLLLLLVDQRLDELGDVLLAGCGAVELATHLGKCLVDLCKALVDMITQVDEVLP